MALSRTRLFTALMLALAAPAAAQEPGTLAGRVVTQTGAPVPAAEVRATRPGDTATVAAARSGPDGRFALRLPAGGYLLRASHLGRSATATVEVAAGAAAQAGDLRLGALVLDGVEVRAERPPVQHAEDRNVYSVRDMPVAAGVAADVMRTLPELEVDLDGTIRMVGNRPVTIHLNGRPSPLRGEALTEFIRNLPADRIDRIEVIPNPSVRFEGGEGAIVNIVLRRDVQLGLSGSVALNAATRGGNGVSGQVAYQRGRLTLFGGGSTRSWSYSDRTRELRENLLATPVTVFDQDRENQGRSAHVSADLTAELSLSERETLWGSVTSYLGDWGSDGLSFNRVLDRSGDSLRVFQRSTRSDSEFRAWDFALGFRRIVEAQRNELALEVRRSTHGDDQAGGHEETDLWHAGPEPLPFELRLTENGSDEGTLTGKLDYMRPVLGVRMEVGVRVSREETDREQRMRIFDRADGPPVEVTTDPFAYTDEQGAGYLNLSRKIGRVSLQGGLRAEATSLSLRAGNDAQVFERDYFSLFPSANVSTQLREGVDLRLSYSGRVRRPWIWDLNPFVQQTDPLNVRFGNPELEPARTRSLSMDLSWRARMLTLRLAPYYRRTDDEIEYLRTVDSLGVATTLPRNLVTVRNYGASLNASLRLGELGTISSAVGASRDQRDAGPLGEAYSRSGSSRFLSGNASLQPGRGFSLQGSLRVNSPRVTAQGRYSSTAFTQLGLRKELFSGRSALDVRVTDPFDLYRSTFVSSDPSFAGSGTSRSSWGARALAVSFTFRFGRPPQRRSTQAEGPEAAPPQ